MGIVSEPFEVWREPEGMADVIASVVGRLGLGGAPVTMTTTAELGGEEFLQRPASAFPSSHNACSFVSSSCGAEASNRTGRCEEAMTCSRSPFPIASRAQLTESAPLSGERLPPAASALAQAKQDDRCFVEGEERQRLEQRGHGVRTGQQRAEDGDPD